MNDIEPFHSLGVAAIGAAAEQVGEADDAVERRADFVAHVGQERGAGRGWPARRGAWPLAARTFRSLDLAFELFGRSPQGLFGPLAVADVEGDALQKKRTSLFVANDARFSVDPDLAAVPRNKAVLRTEIDAGSTRAGELASPSTLVATRRSSPLDGRSPSVLAAK